MPAMSQSATSRRIVNTLPLRADDQLKHHRKFSTNYAAVARYSMRVPPLVVFFATTTAALLLYTQFALPVATCAHQRSFRLVRDLERWTDPAFARERLKIFVYDLPARFNQDLVDLSIRSRGRIRDPRCDDNFYSSELHVHQFLKNSPVRTDNPEEADFFYVPIYSTCALITNQPPNRERVGREFQRAMDIIINEFPYWNRTNGRDHVYLFAQGHGALLSGNWSRYKNGIFLVHNGEFSKPEYTPHKDVTIPPELRSYFEPYWMNEEKNDAKYKKKYLAQFGGQVVSVNVSDHRGSNYSGGVRQYIQAHLTRNPDYRITGVRSDTYLADMKRSKFCLAPEGWHPWSPRPYYSVLMGCIPVIISEVQELAFEHFIDWDSFAVWIRPSEIAKMDQILRSFSDEEVERRRQAEKKVWRALWYAGDGLANQAILRSLYIRKYESAPRRQFSSI